MDFDVNYNLRYLDMDTEVKKWIEQAPKSLKLSRGQKSFYHGQPQVKLFFDIV